MSYRIVALVDGRWAVNQRRTSVKKGDTIAFSYEHEARWFVERGMAQWEGSQTAPAPAPIETKEEKVEDLKVSEPEPVAEPKPAPKKAAKKATKK